MSQGSEVAGVCDGRPAVLALLPEALEIRPAGAGDVRRIALGDGVEVALSERGPMTLFGVAGGFLLALGALWAINGSASLTASAIAGGAGIALFALAFALRVTVVEVKAPPQPSVLFLCRGRARQQAHELVETLRISRPGCTRAPSSNFVTFILAELRALGSGEAARRREYRLVAGAKADPEMEARFVKARPRIAAWNLLFTLAMPLAGAALAFAVGRLWGQTEALIAALVALVVLVFVGLRALPRTQAMLARWLSRSAQ